MKDRKGLVISIVILFILVLSAIGAGYYFYTQYTEKISGLETTQTKLREKIYGFRDELSKVKTDLEEQARNIRTVQTVAEQSKTAGTDLMARVDSLEAMLKEWQEKQEKLLSKVDSLQEDVQEELVEEETIAKVELGEVRVEKEPVDNNGS